MAKRTYIDLINQEILSKEDVTKKSIGISKETKLKLDQFTEDVSLNGQVSMISTFYKQAKSLQVDITSIISEYDSFCAKYSEKMPKIELLAHLLSKYTSEIEKRENKIKHIENMEQLTDLSSYVMAALVINEFDLAAAAFANLSSFVDEILSSNDEEGSVTAKEKLLYYYDLLNKKVTSDFHESLKQLNWPFVSSSKSKTIEQSALSEEEIIKGFETHFCHLVQLKLPDHMLKKEQAKSALFRDWKPILPPIETMLEPLYKRFYYHFSGDRKTNRLDKPEWYMTQVLTWIRDHEHFLLNTVQPCVNKVDLKIDVKLEFMRGLVTLVVDKMEEDLAKLQALSLDDEDELFSHLVDEALSLEGELQLSLDYPTHMVGPVDVLTAETWFCRWLAVERKFASHKLDQLFSEHTAWKPVTAELKRPECCDSFLGLLLAMTARARRLRSLVRRAQFHRLQLGLIDDFRLRLAQVTKTSAPSLPRWCDVLNVLHAISETLIEWSDDALYVEFWENESARYLCQMSVSNDSDIADDDQGGGDEDHNSTLLRRGSIHKILNETALDLDDPVMMGVIPGNSLVGDHQSVFGPALRLYQHMSRGMLASLVRHVMDEVSARSKAYRRSRWMSLPGGVGGDLGLSASACEMLLVLRDRLHDLEQRLVDPLFTQVWQTLAAQINIFIYKRVILANHFNEGGASQLRFDMFHNLIPLFALYTRRPEGHFRELREAVLLLSLSHGSAVLLKNVLHTALHSSSSRPLVSSTRGDRISDPIAALKDVGVSKLSPDEAELVLSLRVTDKEANI